MKPIWEKAVLFLLVLFVAGNLGFIPSGLAQEKLEVKIGDASPAVERHSHKLDITADSLKQGKMEYLLGSSSKANHRVTLTKQQVADIRNGTTIIVESDKSQDAGDIKAHQHKVTITLKAEKEERSGW